MTVCVAGVQMSGVWGDPEATLPIANEWCRRAAEEGADLVCFPEQFATGWAPCLGQYVQDPEGSISRALARMARAHRIFVVGSYVERHRPLPFNATSVFDRSGERVITYRKIHLFSPGGESHCFSPGEDLALFEVGGARFGIAVCYDLRFSPLFRLYADRGVHGVLVPSAWPTSRISHWERLLPARAVEYQHYLVGVNRTGDTPFEGYNGRSMAVDPRGAVFSRLSDAEGLLLARIDPRTVEEVREEFPAGRDRRPDLYRRLGGA